MFMYCTKLTAKVDPTQCAFFNALLLHTHNGDLDCYTNQTKQIVK